LRLFAPAAASTTFAACVSALKRALAYGTPEIFNSDRDSQFTSEAFTGVLKQPAIRISMNGRGRAPDNIFVERLWRGVKYEAVYLKDNQAVPEAAQGLDGIFHFTTTSGRTRASMAGRRRRCSLATPPWPAVN